MRTKSRGGIVSTSKPGWMQDFRLDSNGNWVPSSAKVNWTNTLRNGSIESITYDDKKRSGKTKRTRYCKHDCVYMQNSQEEHSYYLNAQGTLRRVYVSGGYYTPDFSAVPNLASIHLEALDFFKSGCVEKHFDLAVDLLEWRQVSTLLPSVLKSFKSLGANFAKFSFNFAKDSKRALKDLSNLHLTYAFGIKPLVSDVVDLIKSLKALEEKIAWLRKNQGKPVKVAFKKDLSTSLLPSTVIENYSTNTSVDQVLAYRCRYRAYAVLVYNVEGLSDLELKLRVLTRNFGLDKPASWLYEMIPFSFVLDWVLKVGDLIENLSPSISLPYTFLDVGYSVKIEEVRERHSTFTFPYKGDNYHSYGKRKRTLFFREPGLPTSFSIATGDPGANQLALAISLAIQRWK